MEKSGGVPAFAGMTAKDYRECCERWVPEVAGSRIISHPWPVRDESPANFLDPGSSAIHGLSGMGPSWSQFALLVIPAQAGIHLGEWRNQNGSRLAPERRQKTSGYVTGAGARRHWIPDHQPSMACPGWVRRGLNWPCGWRACLRQVQPRARLRSGWDARARCGRDPRRCP